MTNWATIILNGVSWLSLLSGLTIKNEELNQKNAQVKSLSAAVSACESEPLPMPMFKSDTVFVQKTDTMYIKVPYLIVRVDTVEKVVNKHDTVIDWKVVKPMIR